MNDTRTDAQRGIYPPAILAKLDQYTATTAEAAAHLAAVRDYVVRGRQLIAEMGDIPEDTDGCADQAKMAALGIGDLFDLLGDVATLDELGMAAFEVEPSRFDWKLI